MTSRYLPTIQHREERILVAAAPIEIRGRPYINEAGLTVERTLWWHRGEVIFVFERTGD